MCCGEKDNLRLRSTYLCGTPQFYKFIRCNVQQEAGESVEACVGFLGRAHSLYL